MMRVFVIGSTGMLGKYVSTYLKNYYEIVEIGRNDIDVSSIKESELRAKFVHLKINSGDVVINCAGTIKPRVDQLGDLNAVLVNSVFPRILANVCEYYDVKMIHPTTDCVYSGNKGKYSENDNYDVYDVYGMTKALGEPKNCTVIRTSIIGEEVNQGRSLIEWVKSEKNKTVHGFTNHFWNGVTCLEFAKICKKMIDQNMFWVGTRHLHSNTLNKKELVELISNSFNLNVTVVEKQTEKSCDRSITTIYEDLSKFEIPTLENQLNELKNFSEQLYR
jgi:dTDP-4-dehydrorhamnose reductase